MAQRDGNVDSTHVDSRRAIYHVHAGRGGFSSDPCGPIAFRGRFHAFYQHQHATCQWYWGLCWDHVVSDDLVHWRNLPPAVVPTPGGLDADGCFSGTVELDPELGVPVILYTGVYLKDNADAVAAHGLPPTQHDPGTRFVEKQLAAVPADPDDPDLTHWIKLPAPVISLPPAGLNISCWRDPFVAHRPAAAGGEGDEWVVLLASGIRAVGGAVLRFRSKHLTHSWKFDGLLCRGDNAALGIRGQDWECPILAQLPSTSNAAAIAATAALPGAAAASAAKLPAGLSLVAAGWQLPAPDSSDSSSSGINLQAVAPSTPALKSCPNKQPSLSTLSAFGSSVSLQVGATAAAADDASSCTSRSSTAAAAPSPAPSPAPPASGSSPSAAVSIAASMALPLTEPALAAAEAAAAAASSPPDASLAHPAVSVEAWVEHQTQQQGESVLAVAAAAAADVAHDAASSNAVLTASGSENDSRWWFCFSPDACNNPITWFLGRYDGSTFDILNADGPHRLDLGTTLYAATLWQDPQGRQLLYGWIQEHRRVPNPPALCDHYSYAGCISTPRVLQLVDGRQLFQTPLQEINALRTNVSWHATDVQLSQGDTLLPLQVVSGTHLDINITLLPPAAAPAATPASSSASAAPSGSGSASSAAAGPHAAADDDRARAGLVFKSWRVEGKGAAVLSFDWGSAELSIVFDEPFPDAYNPHPEDTPERRRVGGRLRYYAAGDPLSLRVLLDGSALEVFTGTGETLTTRVYRGHPPKCGCSGPAAQAPAAAPANSNSDNASDSTSTSSSSSSSSVTSASSLTEQQQQQQHQHEEDDETGIALFAAGAAVTVSRVDVWEMGSCWVAPSRPPPRPPALLQQQLHAAAAHHHSSTAAPAAVAEVVVLGGQLECSRPEQQQQQEQPDHHSHHAAGDQATVNEGFLENLHISAAAVEHPVTAK